jgi:hypothetical protein
MKEGATHSEHRIHIFINKKLFEFERHVQTGEHLKQCAGIPLGTFSFSSVQEKMR